MLAFRNIMNTKFASICKTKPHIMEGTSPAPLGFADESYEPHSGPSASDIYQWGRGESIGVREVSIGPDLPGCLMVN